MKSLQALTVQELRAEIQKTDRLVGTTRTRLRNQERKLLDLKLVLLARLEEGGSEDQSE